jgi:hypothetical protein
MAHTGGGRIHIRPRPPDAGAGNPRAARVASFSQSTPIWERHATRACSGKRRGEPGGLRVMQQHQIAWPYLVDQLGRVRANVPDGPPSQLLPEFLHRPDQPRVPLATDNGL